MGLEGAVRLGYRAELDAMGDDDACGRRYGSSSPSCASEAGR